MFQLDLKVVRGDTFRRTLRFLDKTTGEPKDLSSWTWSSQIRRDPDDAEPLASFTIDGTQASQGYLSLGLSASVTEDLVTSFWDLQGTLAGETPAERAARLQAAGLLDTAQQVDAVRLGLLTAGQVSVAAAEQAVNATTLLGKARTATGANNTFLAVTSPSNAQVVAQVKAVTRQVNA